MTATKIKPSKLDLYDDRGSVVIAWVDADDGDMGGCVGQEFGHSLSAIDNGLAKAQKTQNWDNFEYFHTERYARQLANAGHDGLTHSNSGYAFENTASAKRFLVKLRANQQVAAKQFADGIPRAGLGGRGTCRWLEAAEGMEVVTTKQAITRAIELISSPIDTSAARLVDIRQFPDDVLIAWSAWISSPQPASRRDRMALVAALREWRQQNTYADSASLDQLIVLVENNIEVTASVLLNLNPPLPGASPRDHWPEAVRVAWDLYFSGEQESPTNVLAALRAWHDALPSDEDPRAWGWHLDTEEAVLHGPFATREAVVADIRWAGVEPGHAILGRCVPRTVPSYGAARIREDTEEILAYEGMLNVKVALRPGAEEALDEWLAKYVTVESHPWELVDTETWWGDQEPTDDDVIGMRPQ